MTLNSNKSYPRWFEISIPFHFPYSNRQAAFERSIVHSLDRSEGNIYYPANRYQAAHLIYKLLMLNMSNNVRCFGSCIHLYKRTKDKNLIKNLICPHYAINAFDFGFL